MKISVKVQPRASKDEVAENADGSLKVYLRTAPTDGRANKELIDTLAKHYRVKKSDIRIITGKTSRNKIVEVAGG
ncbi:MAG: DUF167 domain-containing protein [Candidatus Omnitrophica bacterium]|nr:DUF167 domain-containing protein [Candidatus Omnitrophota bacterium]